MATATPGCQISQYPELSSCFHNPAANLNVNTEIIHNLYFQFLVQMEDSIPEVFYLIS